MAGVISAADETIIELFSGLSARHFAKLIRQLRAEGADPALKGRPWKLSFRDRVLMVAVYPDAALASFAACGKDTTVTLNPGEQHVIRFLAHAAEQTCRWDVALEYTADGVRQTDTLTSKGEQAFALVALLPIESYETVIVPWTYCTDHEGRVLPDPEAAAIVTEMYTGGGSADCP